MSLCDLGFGSTLFKNNMQFGYYTESDGKYPYTMDLLQLESYQGSTGKLSFHDRLAGVFTPLHLPQWETMLRNHPDKEYKEYIEGYM